MAGDQWCAVDRILDGSLPSGGEIQNEVKAFEQFLASRPEPKAMKAAANSIRLVAALISGYMADMSEHGARPAPWNEPESKPGPAYDDANPHA
jgi:hypothetical protein